MIKIIFLFWLELITFNPKAVAQKKHEINWLSFSQLEDSLAVNPKKVFIDLYADWCVVCKKMDQTTFKDSEFVHLINENYYAVKMNVETNDTLSFGGKAYVNKRLNRVNPLHEIAQLMGSRKNHEFSLPVYIILNENFEAQVRYFQYLSADQFTAILSKNVIDFATQSERREAITPD